MSDTNVLVTIKICPCCKWEDQPRQEWPVIEYLARSLSIDKQKRVQILCADCIMQYTWKGI